MELLLLKWQKEKIHNGQTHPIKPLEMERGADLTEMEVEKLEMGPCFVM